MGKKLFGTVLTALLVLAMGGTALATLKVGSNNTYGPASMSGTDYGCNQTVWANDVWNRYFVVSSSPVTVGGHVQYDVTRWDKAGTFHTVAGPSPASGCTSSGNTVTGGIRGHFHGFVNYVVQCPTTTSCLDDAAAQTFIDSCSADQSCTTDGFVAAAFGVDATYGFGTYKYVYTSRNSTLCLKRWVDQTSGETGDIATTCSV